jgi:hypothetical protein
MHTATGSPVAKEALDPIGHCTGSKRPSTAPFPTTGDENGNSDQSRPPRRCRGGRRRPRENCRTNPSWLPPWYRRSRRTALTRCFDDGRLALDNNPAERALRCVAIGRKNLPLCRFRCRGPPRCRSLYSLIESVKLNGLNPQLYIADMLAHTGDHPARRIADLLPWYCKSPVITHAA